MNPDPGSTENALFGVEATSAKNAWAVGYSNSGSGRQSLVEHWNGTLWKVQPSPDPGQGGNELYGVDGSSGSDAWAVGKFVDTTMDRTFAVHCC